MTRETPRPPAPSTFVRPLDWAQAHFTLGTGYAGQYLYSGESGIVVVTKVPAGVDGPTWHVHPSDQSYVVLEGTLTVDLGDDVVTVPAGSAVFIPAGLPHQNRNTGEVEEIHFEVVAPGVLPSVRASETVGETSPGSHGVAGLVPFVGRGASRAPGTDAVTEEWLIDRARGAHHAGIAMVDVPGGHEVAPLHVHDFDQLYFVDEGVLSAQIGITTIEVPRHNLVVVPAMVPHRAWNAQAGPERHLLVVIPEPTGDPADDTWDVDFAPVAGPPRT